MTPVELNDEERALLRVLLKEFLTKQSTNRDMQSLTALRVFVKTLRSKLI